MNKITTVNFERRSYSIYNTSNDPEAPRYQIDSAVDRTIEGAVKRAFSYYYRATNKNQIGGCLPQSFGLPKEMYASNFEWIEYTVPGPIEEYVLSDAA